MSKHRREYFYCVDVYSKCGLFNKFENGIVTNVSDDENPVPHGDTLDELRDDMLNKYETADHCKIISFNLLSEGLVEV